MELKDKLEARMQNMQSKPDSDDTTILEEAKRRAALLKAFVDEVMVEGVDYGVCPGTSKPSLFKPGAEKLCDAFGFSKHVEISHRTEDWEQGIFHYEVRVTLVDAESGNIAAQGLGSCNSREKKYAKSIPANIVNTILKMAEKRAFIGATLAATGSSSQFTQDMEDFAPRAKPSVTNKNQQILQLVRGKGIAFDQLRQILFQRYKVNDSRQLSDSQAADFIRWLSQPQSMGEAL